MPDVFSPAKRSEVMSRIRSRGNRDTELALASLFRRHGITGWRRHLPIRNAEGGMRNGKAGAPRISFRTPRSALRSFSVRPVFVFPKRRLAVFVDGCFWHACPIHATKPRNNAAFWRKKLAANQARDRLVSRTLQRAGWRVLRIWEHELACLKPRKRSTRHSRNSSSSPQPSPVTSCHPLPSDGRGPTPAPAGVGEARLLRRIWKALTPAGQST